MNILETGEGNKESIYLGFKTQKNCWEVGKDNKVDVEYIQIDYSTIATGWGRFQEGMGFDYKWDETPGVVDSRPLDDNPDARYKRAVSFWVSVHGIDRPLLWRSIAAGETESIQDILNLFWKERETNKGLLPTFKFVGTEVRAKSNKQQTKNWTITATKWELAKWVERWGSFVIPSIDKNGSPVYDDQEPLISNGNVHFPNDDDAKGGLDFDDIPF